jgi:hypothetical protein
MIFVNAALSIFSMTEWFGGTDLKEERSAKKLYRSAAEKADFPCGRTIIATTRRFQLGPRILVGTFRSKQRLTGMCV